MQLVDCSNMFLCLGILLVYSRQSFRICITAPMITCS